jgi:hypothetical protein
MPGRATISESPTENTATMISTSGAKRPPQSADESRPATKTYSVAASQPVEPEDAYLTGVSRSLQRRLLGLNVDRARGQSRPHSDAKVAELNAAGSRAEANSVSTKGEKNTKRA